MSQQNPDPPSVDRLRDDIDSGRTGEKVPGSDPAAAPLGTDAEAGGTPPTRAERALEVRSRPSAAPATGAPAHRGRWLWAAGIAPGASRAHRDVRRGTLALQDAPRPEPELPGSRPGRDAGARARRGA